MLSYRLYKKIYNKSFNDYLFFVFTCIKYTCKKLLGIPYHTYMCIRYPFLYPRNRYTDKYEAHILRNQRNILYRKSFIDLSISGVLEREDKSFQNYLNFLGLTVRLKDKQKLIITNTKDFSNVIDEQEYDIKSLIWGDNKFKVLGISLGFSVSGNPIIHIHVTPFDKSDITNYGFCQHSYKIKNNRFYYYCYKLITWFDVKVLNRILILPTFNEWNVLKGYPGWYKVFGKQLLKDLKKQLKKDKMLYKWRILDIKEKWGYFNLYYNYGSKELRDLIDSYSLLSKKICIECGKPAEVASINWIRYYCKECVDKNNIINYKILNNSK